ncbi:unnamed protein product [Leuciscus chuanchicus]
MVPSPKSVRWMDVRLRERNRVQRCHASSALDQNHNRQDIYDPTDSGTKDLSRVRPQGGLSPVAQSKDPQSYTLILHKTKQLYIKRPLSVSPLDSFSRTERHIETPMYMDPVCRT